MLLLLLLTLTWPEKKNWSFIVTSDCTGLEMSLFIDSLSFYVSTAHQADWFKINKGLVFVRSRAATQRRQLLFVFLIMSLFVVYFIIYHQNIFADKRGVTNVVHKLIASTPKQSSFNQNYLLFVFDKQVSYVNFVITLCVLTYTLTLLFKCLFMTHFPF